MSIVLWASEDVVVSEAKSKYDSPKPKSQYFPGIDYGIHRNGLLWTTVHNNGIIGNVYGYPIEDLQKSAPSFYHPRYSRKQHGYWAALWVGGIVGKDSLVSVGLGTESYPYQWALPVELWPDEWPFGSLEVRSNLPTSPHYHPKAKAGMEFHSVYTDTFQGEWFIPDNEYDRRRHRPMGLEIHQSSYSWSENYAADFIILDYSIRNIGMDTIRDAWVGLYYAGCVQHRSEVPSPPSDDIAGYMYSAPYEFEELGNELMQTMYILDADGNAFSLPWDLIKTTNAFSITPLQMPDEAAINNFNWWIHPWSGNINWGPRRASSVEYPLRLFQGELGQPRSDPDKYYMMARPEIDYSGYEMAVDHSRAGWLSPPEYAGTYARGNFPQILTTYGPFDLLPGEARPLTLVMTIGEEVHYDRSAFYHNFDTLNPYPFMEQLDWSDLLTNIRWAKLIYDNPGVDTDFDGDSGKYVLRYEPFTGETTKVYYEGDGVPDFRGAQAPPPPEVRVIPSDGKIVIRWNGYLTETYYDPLSFIRDFEGYRVYISRSPLVSDATLLASWDQENFNWYRYEKLRRDYVMISIPKTIRELRDLFGEEFDPLDYSRLDPLEWEGKLYFFDQVDYNMSDLTIPGGIHKLYPEAILDTTDVDEEGRLRYYEYEFIVENRLPTVPYYVSVTAFDFGHPPKSLEPLESSVVANQREVYAIGQESVEASELNVYVYPNPYRIDADYAARGFENRGDQTSSERARRVYFANLPYRCTISIYSLDGDLIKRLEHDEPEGSGTRAVHEWDMITRNVQMITSGLYYWVVESGSDTQMGKLVVLK